jgi:uncharacterized protein YjbI with pentapeptide repeats
VEANLRGANLGGANLRGANLRGANLVDIKGLVKIIGVVPGNYYWKRFGAGLKNRDFQYRLGLNVLPKGQVFASDERVICSYPGFHFASRSWCAVNYPDLPLEAQIHIPINARINEPWASDGKASADRIEILRVFSTTTGKNVTKQFRQMKKHGGKNA